MAGESSGLFQVVVSFIDRHGEPLTGRHWRVTAWDRDPIVDDRLAAGPLDASGSARLLFSVSDVMSLDSPGERKPDLYFELMHKGTTLFVSEVFPDVDFETLDPVSGDPDGLTRSFGPFRVDWPPADD